MVPAKYSDASFEFILGNIEKDRADLAVGTAGILLAAPLDRKRWLRLWIGGQ